MLDGAGPRLAPGGARRSTAMDPEMQEPAAGARPDLALVDDLEHDTVPVGWLFESPARPIYQRTHPYYGPVYALTGSDGVKALPDGREVVVMPWSGTGGQLSVGRRTGFWDDTWNYTTFPRAVAAAEAWDGTGEPVGWYRHPNTGRRRRDGDPATEWIQP